MRCFAALDLDRDCLIRPHKDDAGDILEGWRLPVGDGNDVIAGPDARIRSCGLWHHVRDHVVARRPRETEEGSEDQNRQQEIGHWSGEHHEEALPHRPNLKGALA